MKSPMEELLEAITGLLGDDSMGDEEKILIIEQALAMIQSEQEG